MLPETSKLTVSWMTRKDMPQVMEIEYLSQQYPNTEAQLLKILKNENCVGMVARIRDSVLGHMIYELLPNEFRILNFAVDSSCWRRGVGTAMVEKLFSKMEQQKRQVIWTIVPSENMPAVRFFRELGFKATETFTEAFTHISPKGPVCVIEERYVMRYSIEGK